MSGTARENVPKPVRLSSPTKMSEPMPAASRPGTSTTLIMAPPSPAASISRNAPASGDPSSVLMAAKLPAAPINITAWGAASFFRKWKAKMPSPLPMAISGASGPNTTPRLSVAKAAMMMPGKIDRTHGPGRLEPLGGLMSCGPGQVTDG